MSYSDDKRELLKLKQGIIEESETIKEEKPIQTELHGKAKIANFFYHYKIHLLVIVFFTAVLSFLIYSSVTKEQMDARVLLFASDGSVSSSLYIKSKSIEEALEMYCPDFDENGNVHVETYYIDMSDNQQSDYYYASQAKLYGEFSLGYAQMFIGNMGTFGNMIGVDSPEEVFVNLSELYPEDENIVDDYYYKVSGTAFAGAANYLESCPDDLYIVVRQDFAGFSGDDPKTAVYHERCLEIFDNIVKDNKVTVKTVTE